MSFPKFGHSACAWVALAPLLVAIARATGRTGAPAIARPLRRAFLLGLASGLVYFAGALYWLVDVMVIYGGLARPVALAVAALLVTYLAMYPAIFALIVGALARRFGTWALAVAPAAWVATELGRATLLTGFPWALVGASQVTWLPIAQVASLAGVFGVSALVTLGSAAVAMALAARGPRRVVMPAATLILIVIAAGWGRARMAAGELTAQGTPVRVGLVQGNFSQDIKWEASLVPVILDRYLRLSAETIQRGAQLVVWPESSVPFYFLGEPERAESIRRLARAGRAHMLLGSDEYELGDGAAGGAAEVRIYNSAFMLRPDGAVSGVYRKMHLVPFGEYVPLQRLLFFVAPLVQAVSNFSPGDRPALLPVGEHRASAAICYEVVYPWLIGRFVRDGSELITTITNDAWFGRSSAAYQHFEQASMRAIEQGRYLVRAANTGLSGVVDPYGRVLERTNLFETSTIVREVRFLQGRTLYNRVGDAVAYACLAITALALLAVRRTPQSGRNP